MENGYDSVEVFDGDLSKSISLHKHSGSTKPELIVSSGNKLRVNLLSDQFYSGTGFLAQYKASKFDKELFFFVVWLTAKRRIGLFPTNLLTCSTQKIPKPRSINFLSNSDILQSFALILQSTLFL